VKIDSNQSGRHHPMVIIGILFFVFGFVTWLGSVLIPYLRIACELNNFESYLVAFSFYISYFIMAVPSAWVLSKTGYKNGISLGLLIMAVGTFVFIPAALDRNYFIFLTGLFIQGTGLAILQTAANPYVTILGPTESAARRISIMGICNGIAGVTAPLILGAIMLKDADNIVTSLDAFTKNAQLDALAHKVIMPYAIMMLALLLLATMVYFSSLPEISGEEEEEVSALPARKNIFQYPHLLLGVVTLFFYVGVEVIAADTVISYASFQGFPLAKGKYFSSFTLVNMLVGYVIGVFLIPKYLSQKRALQISTVLGVIFAACALVFNGLTSIVFISMLGLANSLMWPSIWPLATYGIGSHLKKGAALLIMAIGGGALLPLLYGRLADVFDPHNAYWLLIPSYLLILFYAFAGHKIGLEMRRK
jgi:glucose/galactose transporter